MGNEGSVEQPSEPTLVQTKTESKTTETTTKGTKRIAKGTKTKTRKRAKKVSNDPACPICCETFTKMVRKPIVCPYESCKFAACKACIMKYLQEDTYQEAHCMSCRNPWSDAFVKDSCTKVFWQGPFKDHIDRLFMDRERNLLPQTQEWMEYDVFKKNVDKRKRKLEQKIAQIRQEFHTKLQAALKPHIDTHRAISGLGGILDRDLRSSEMPTLVLDQEKLTVRRKDGQPIQGLAASFKTKEEEKERKDPVSALAGFQCPKESCRGFINNRGQCGTCLIFICAKCRQTKAAYVDPDHECKEEDVESVKFLRKDSKPCPSCGAPIHKIAGCSHMWCTACHTAFCWNTLKIMNAARAHNPHMVQWLIANGGNGQGGTIRQRRAAAADPVYNDINRKMKAAPKILKFLPQLWALHNHFLWVIEGLQAPIRNSRYLRDCRLRYLRGAIGESQWKSVALAHQKKVDRIKTKVQLMETFMLGADALVRCNLETKGPQAIREEAHRLREFFNRSWSMAFKAGEVGSVKRQISPEFYWHRTSCTCVGRRACATCSRRNI